MMHTNSQNPRKNNPRLGTDGIANLVYGTCMTLAFGVQVILTRVNIIARLVTDLSADAALFCVVRSTSLSLAQDRIQ